MGKDRVCQGHRLEHSLGSGECRLEGKIGLDFLIL